MALIAWIVLSVYTSGVCIINLVLAKRFDRIEYGTYTKSNDLSRVIQIGLLRGIESGAVDAVHAQKSIGYVSHYMNYIEISRFQRKAIHGLIGFCFLQNIAVYFMIDYALWPDVLKLIHFCFVPTLLLGETISLFKNMLFLNKVNVRTEYELNQANPD